MAYVYVIMADTIDGQYIEDIFLNEDKAEQYKDILNDADRSVASYSIERFQLK